MKKAVELYEKEGNYITCYDYQPILETFGDILIQVDDSDYQGDSRVLYKSGDKYGILIFGWGSCSGCDALQSCTTFDAIDELIEGMYNDIIWFGCKEDALKWVVERDWELQYAWHVNKTKQFIQKVTEYLKG